MRPLYNEEVLELERLLDLMQYPEKYGCRFDPGDPATYQGRVGYIIHSVAATIASLRTRNVRNLLGGGDPGRRP